jgi:hypothetical protein
MPPRTISATSLTHWPISSPKRLMMGRNVSARGPRRTENDKYGPQSCYVRFALQPFRPTARDAHLSSNPSQISESRQRVFSRPL